MVVDGGCVRENGQLLYNGDRVLVFQDEKVLGWMV